MTHHRTYFARMAALVVLGLLAAACATKVEPTTGTYKVGSPYQINGVWYYPQEDPNYDQTGIASWYGDPFHGRKTANGETFDKNLITAAHPTLPMPTIARVTNLENGRAIIVRINDRGPFAKGRIIDLSQKAAQLLGFEQAGIAKVRVQYVGRADEDDMPVGVAQTPPELRTGPQAAPRSDVAAGALAPVAGVSAAPASAPAALPRPQAAPVASTTVSVPKPDGRVEQVRVAGGTQMYVQAGAFVSEGNATRLARTLRSLGETSVAPAMINGQRYYRVRVGPLASVSAADSMLQRVLDAGYAGAQIIID